MKEEKFLRKDEEKTARKKTWSEKSKEVKNSYLRAMKEPTFVDEFYRNLFFLKPSIEEYFKDTKWSYQKIAIEKGIEHLLGFLEEGQNDVHRKNILRLAESHSKQGLNIHPHNYYYWVDAMVMTLSELDPSWHKNLEYYCRECLFAPISFMISFYHK